MGHSQIARWMTVQEQLTHEQIDEDIWVKKGLHTEASLIQGAWKLWSTRRLFRSAQKAALLIQSSTRMLLSRRRTIKAVAEGLDSPMVTLRGRYLCGKPMLPIENTSVPNVQDAGSEKRPRRTARLTTLSSTTSSTSSAPAIISRLTLENTKRNAEYSRVKIRVEEVAMDVPRPPNSPDRTNWSTKPPRSQLSTDEEEDSYGNEGRPCLKWDRKIVYLGREAAKREPITEPKPILKKNALERMPVVEPPAEPEEVLVKKPVYPEDPSPAHLFAVEDILEGLQKHFMPAKGGKRKKRARSKSKRK